MDPPVQYTTGIVVRIVDAKGEFDIKYAPASSDTSSAPHVQVGTEMVDGPMRVRITGIDSEGHVLRAVNVHREVSVQITDLKRGNEYTIGECPTNLDVGT